METGNIPFEKFEILEKHITYWGFTYDHIIYVPVEFELVEDGVRSPSKEYQMNIDDKVCKILEDYVAEERRTTIRGTPEERLEQVKKLIITLSETHPELLK